MALTKQQLIAEILPGLNKVFEDAYGNYPASWFAESHMNENKYYKEIEGIALPTLRDLWHVRFGDLISSEALGNELPEKNDYMYAVTVVLKQWGYLSYDTANHTFKLHDKPTYADHRQQSSTV